MGLLWECSLKYFVGIACDFVHVDALSIIVVAAGFCSSGLLKIRFELSSRSFSLFYFEDLFGLALILVLLYLALVQ